ncbi:DKNYY domain-containing protein [Pseudomonas aeruginosa]
MSEPLLLAATIRMPPDAFRRWLAAPAPAAFDDWPEPFADLPVGESAATIKAELVRRVVDALTSGHAQLLCQHDAASGELRFAACCFQGETAAARIDIRDLMALLRTTADFRIRQGEDWAVAFDLGGPPLAAVSIRKGRAELRADAPSIWPDWLSDWLGHLDGMGPTADLRRWLAPSLLREVKQTVQLGALHATPQRPFAYDLAFRTDGEHVLHSGPLPPGGGTVVADADPPSFRRLTAGNDGEAFYADRNAVWYFDFQFRLHRLPERPSAPLRGFRCDEGTPLLLCGDALWHPVKTSYEDNTPEGRRRLLEAVVQQGGLPTCEAVYQLFWLRRIEVDGASFRALDDGLFEDARHVYLQSMEKGLCVLEDERPGLMRRIGRVWHGVRHAINGWRSLTLSHGPLRHLGGHYYADAGGAWYADHGWSRLEDAAAELTVAPFNRALAWDGVHVWYEGQPVAGADGATVAPVPGAQAGFLHWWQDARHVYYGANVLPDAVAGQLKVCAGSAYARQGKAIYYMQEPMPQADASTFEVIEWYFARDSHREYVYGPPLDAC